MLPAIFKMPFMKATWGFIDPIAMSTNASSLTVKVVSALTPAAGAPSYSLALFKSMAAHEREIKNVETR